MKLSRVKKWNVQYGYEGNDQRCVVYAFKVMLSQSHVRVLSTLKIELDCPNVICHNVC